MFRVVVKVFVTSFIKPTDLNRSSYGSCLKSLNLAKGSWLFGISAGLWNIFVQVCHYLCTLCSVSLRLWTFLIEFIIFQSVDIVPKSPTFYWTVRILRKCYQFLSPEQYAAVPSFGNCGLIGSNSILCVWFEEIQSLLTCKRKRKLAALPHSWQVNSYD